MRPIRLILLVSALAAAYFAQYIFDARSLESLPTWLLNGLPPLADLARWLPADLFRLAAVLMGGAALVFGLVILPWQDPTEQPFNRTFTGLDPLPGDPDDLSLAPSLGEATTVGRGRSALPWLLAALALALTIAVGLPLLLTLGEPFWVRFAWLGGLVLFVGAGLLADALHRRPSATAQVALDEASTAQPERGWPWLLLLLLLATLLVGWRLGDVPPRVPVESAGVALSARSLLAGEFSGLFRDASPLPPLAYTGTALALLASDVLNAAGLPRLGLRIDVLLGLRLGSLVTGLLLVVATWLLGCEVFRRAPSIAIGEPETLGEPGELEAVDNAEDSSASAAIEIVPSKTAATSDEVTLPSETHLLEDDGRTTALLAATLLATGYTFSHFSHQPLFLEPVLWGVGGLWALLRGVRERRLALVALSGAATGVAGLLYGSGLVFGLVGVVWWLGLWLLQHLWFTEGEPAVVERATAAGEIEAIWAVRRYTALGQAAWTWAGGWLVAMGPLLAVWLRTPSAFRGQTFEPSLFSPVAESQLQGVFLQNGAWTIFWQNARASLLAFNLSGDASSLFGYPEAMIAGGLGALLLLGAGALLLNLDRLPGWLLLTWLLLAALAGSTLALAAPYWPHLLPLLPAAALTLAFALDRAATTVLELTTSRLGSLVAYLVVGLVAWTTLTGWTDYREFVLNRGTSAESTAPSGVALSADVLPSDDVLPSYLARALQSLPTDARVALPAARYWDEPVVQLVSAGRVRFALPEGGVATTDLAALDYILLLPGDLDAALIDLRATANAAADAPPSTLRTVRDGRANPVLYIVTLTR